MSAYDLRVWVYNTYLDKAPALRDLDGYAKGVVQTAIDIMKYR